MGIKKGDRLLLTSHGFQTEVEAADDESDGAVVVKQHGTFATCSVADLEPAGERAPEDAIGITGNQVDATNEHPTCPTCGDIGVFVPPNWADNVRRVICIRFRCSNDHEWVQEYPAK